MRSCQYSIGRAALLALADLVDGCPLAIAYGAWLWRVGLGLGADWLAGHQPELLAALSPRRAA